MTSTIIVRTDSKLKEKAQAVASDLGITLTAAINNYLKNFVSEKNISFQKARKSFKDPYGIFKNAKISDKDINDVTKSWMKIIDEFE